MADDPIRAKILDVIEHFQANKPKILEPQNGMADIERISDDERGRRAASEMKTVLGDLTTRLGNSITDLQWILDRGYPKLPVPSPEQMQAAPDILLQQRQVTAAAALFTEQGATVLDLDSATDVPKPATTT